MVLWVVILFILLVVTYYKADKTEKLNKYLTDRVVKLEDEIAGLRIEIKAVKETRASKESLKSIYASLDQKASQESLEQVQRLTKELEHEVFKNNTVDEFISRNQRVYGATSDD